MANSLFPTGPESSYEQRMRRPTPTELEFTMLAFITLAPLGYFILHGLFALLA